MRTQPLPASILQGHRLLSINQALQSQAKMQFKFLLALGAVPALAAVVPTEVTPNQNAVNTPTPIQPGMVNNCNSFYKVVSGDTCQKIQDRYRVSFDDLKRWNTGINGGCTNLQIDNYYCVGVYGVPTSFHLKTRYHVDCTGAINNEVTVENGGELCVNTDCNVGSLEIDAAGACPNGQVQISYWEGPNCSGKWFGYGYTNRGTCRQLWSDGWKFKSLNFRCAAQADDCVTKKTCTFDPEPAKGVCQA